MPKKYAFHVSVTLTFDWESPKVNCLWLVWSHIKWHELNLSISETTKNITFFKVHPSSLILHPSYLSSISLTEILNNTSFLFKKYSICSCLGVSSEGNWTSCSFLKMFRLLSKRLPQFFTTWNCLLVIFQPCPSVCNLCFNKNIYHVSALSFASLNAWLCFFPSISCLHPCVSLPHHGFVATGDTSIDVSCVFFH